MNGNGEQARDRSIMGIGKRSVVFDLDGTLHDRDATLPPFVAAQYQRFSGQLGHIHSHDYQRRWIELDCRGSQWKDKVYQQLIDEFQIDGLSVEELLQDFERHFMDHCIPMKGLSEVLALLKPSYPLGLITNGPEEFQSRTLKGLGVYDWFDVLVFSEVEGIKKPDPEIFRRAVSRLGGRVENSVFVGDHPEADIGGAKAAGLKAVWKRNPYWNQPAAADAVIDELHELPALLTQL